MAFEGLIMSDLRKFSSIVVDGNDRAPNRSMLRATGFKDEDFKKPQIGVASTWSMLTPCNMHIDKLAAKAVEGVDAAGARGLFLALSQLPMEFLWGQKG